MLTIKSKLKLKKKELKMVEANEEKKVHEQP